MTREEAKEVFINRGYITIGEQVYHDPSRWRMACYIISEWLRNEGITIEITGKDACKIDPDELANTVFNILDDNGFDVTVSGGAI